MKNASHIMPNSSHRESNAWIAAFFNSVLVQLMIVVRCMPGHKTRVCMFHSLGVFRPAAFEFMVVIFEDGGDADNLDSEATPVIRTMPAMLGDDERVAE